jgi:hypothetical protein
MGGAVGKGFVAEALDVVAGLDILAIGFDILAVARMRGVLLVWTVAVVGRCLSLAE